MNAVLLPTFMKPLFLNEALGKYITTAKTLHCTFKCILYPGLGHPTAPVIYIDHEAVSYIYISMFSKNW